MIRSVIITSLVLSLALATGCDKPPEGTNPPDDGSQTADNGKGKDKKKGKNKNKTETEGGGEEGGGDDSQDPTKKVCPAETSDYPAPYFDDTLLIRLPKNITEDNFIQENPYFVRLSGEIESVGCVEDFPGAMITYMAMNSYADDTDKDLITLRDETLVSLGYAGHTFSEEKRDDAKRFYQAVLDIPPMDGKPDPARALYQMTAANGLMYVIVYESHPAAWNALKETFYASATKMSFLKP